MFQSSLDELNEFVAASASGQMRSTATNNGRGGRRGRSGCDGRDNTKRLVLGPMCPLTIAAAVIDHATSRTQLKGFGNRFHFGALGSRTLAQVSAFDAIAGHHRTALAHGHSNRWGSDSRLPFLALFGQDNLTVMNTHRERHAALTRLNGHQVLAPIDVTVLAQPSRKHVAQRALQFGAFFEHALWQRTVLAKQFQIMTPLEMHHRLLELASLPLRKDACRQNAFPRAIECTCAKTKENTFLRTNFRRSKRTRHHTQPFVAGQVRILEVQAMSQPFGFVVAGIAHFFGL